MSYIPPALPQFNSKRQAILGRNLEAVARKYGLDVGGIVKMGSNENPLGMGRLALEAVTQGAAKAGRYPDPDGDALRVALGEAHGVPPDWIVLGAGSTEFVDWAARAFVGPGRAAVVSDLSFSAYRSAVRMSGGRSIVVPAVEYGHDLASMAAAVTEEVSVAYLTNPNNPTGTYLSGEALESFLAAIPERVVTMLDEAYVQFVDHDAAYDPAALVRRHPNLAVMRTFSKFYALAGLRVGYAICQPGLAGVFNQVKNIYNVGTVALLGAVAALRDKDHVAATYENNRRGRQQLYAGLRQRGFAFLPTAANYIMVNVGDGAAVNAALLQQGVIVRTLDNYGLDAWIRVSIGLPEENSRFLDALPTAA